MAGVLTNPLFEEWFLHLFGHPVFEPPWYSCSDLDCPEMGPERVVNYATRLSAMRGSFVL